MLRFLTWLFCCKPRFAALVGAGCCTVLMPMVASAQRRPGQGSHRGAQAYRQSAQATSQRSSLQSVVSRPSPVRPTAYSQSEMIIEGPISGGPMHEEYLAEEYVGEFGYPGASPQSHHACDSLGCDSLACGKSSFLLDWSRAELWAGTVAFTGPGNFVGNAGSAAYQTGGAFGFQEGFNFGARMPSLFSGQLGSQVGVRLTQTSLDGSTAGADRRSQMFLTGGLFRRVDYGLQGGMVVDYLHDDWFYKADLLQLRGELSFVTAHRGEWGFRFTNSQQTSDSTIIAGGNSVDLSLESLDSYRFFARRNFGPQLQSSAEFFGGWSEQKNALFGMRIELPLAAELGLEAESLYGTPPSESMLGYDQEWWNIAIALKWTPGRSFGTARDYYRPLFKVADNASLLVQRLRP